MAHYIAIMLAVAAFGAVACGDDPATISVQLFAAELVEDPASPPPQGWRRFEHEGGTRGGRGIYQVAQEPLLTEWNFIALKTASQPDGSVAVTARLNAYGKKQMARHTADLEGGRRHLALSIDGAWVEVMPLLSRVTDRITLFGFAPEEAAQLERYMKTR